MVDELLASCFALTSHDLGHFGTVSIRWFPQITQWIFGENNGSYDYVNIAEYFGLWIIPHDQNYGSAKVVT